MIAIQKSSKIKDVNDGCCLRFLKHYGKGVCVYLEVNENGSPLIKKRLGSEHPQAQKRIYSSSKNLEIYDSFETNIK